MKIWSIIIAVVAAMLYSGVVQAQNKSPEDSFQAGMSAIIKDIAKQRDTVCPKQDDEHKQEICRIRFMAPIAMAAGISADAVTAGFKAASGDKDGLHEYMKKIDQGIDSLQASLDKLAQDYK